MSTCWMLWLEVTSHLNFHTIDSLSCLKFFSALLSTHTKERELPLLLQTAIYSCPRDIRTSLPLTDVLLGERRKARWSRPPSNLCVGNDGARWSLFLLITMGVQITKDNWCQKLHKYLQAYHCLYPELWSAFKQAFCQGFLQIFAGYPFTYVFLFLL